MFRDLARKHQRLSMQDCVQLLKTETRGVLSVLGEDGYPYGMPMNHWYNEEDGNIYFHGGNAGHRLDALKVCSKVSFCTYDRGVCREGEWAKQVKSVIVFGVMDVLSDRETIIDITTKLSRKFTQDEDYIQKEIEAHAHRTLLFRLTPQHICGKTISES